MTFYENLNTLFQEYYDDLGTETNNITITKTDGIKQIIEDEGVLENWFFAGNFGSGKTRASIQLIRLWQRHISQNTHYDSEFIDNNPKFITLQDYIELNNRSIQFKDLYQKIESYRNSWLLVLDDMSLANWSESSINHLTQLIKHRHENRLQTIFTSNKGLTALQKEIPAVISRILEMCGTDNCIQFADTDHRIVKTGQKTKIQFQARTPKQEEEYQKEKFIREIYNFDTETETKIKTF